MTTQSYFKLTWSSYLWVWSEGSTSILFKYRSLCSFNLSAVKSFSTQGSSASTVDGLKYQLVILFIFDRLRAICPKGYQGGSLGSPERPLLKNKQCEKVVFPQESNLQPLNYQKNAGSIPAGRQLFRIACFLSSGRSGDPRLPPW